MYRLRIIKNLISQVLLQVLGSVSNICRARHYCTYLLVFLGSLLSSSSAFATGFGGIESNQEDFLPVEEAYQVLLDISGNQLVMNWTLASGYYLYQHKFHAVATNGEQTQELTLRFAPGKQIFDEYYEKELEVYYFNTVVEAPVPNLPPPYEIKVTSQGCADAGLCYPPRKQFFQINTDGEIVEIEQSGYQQTSSPSPQTIASGTTVPRANQMPASSTSINSIPTTGFVAAALLAILGGIVLNLMPCVFPVLSLKALSFANNTHKKQHVHGWAYTLGVVGSFLVAAIIILIARHTGETLGWGFQLQQPVFVSALTYLFLLMALSLFGMFSFGSRFMGIGQNLTMGGGISASFYTGVLAAVVASPCSAPFMATALGAALTQPAPLALIIFACLGFGMSLPFLALSYSPALANRLPAPGPWMEVLKQALAFPLIGTSIWLLWVLGHQTGVTGIAYILVGAMLLCFTLWLSRFRPVAKLPRLLINMLMLCSLLAAAHLTWHVRDLQITDAPKETGRWEVFSLTKLEQLRSEGKPVFVNLTADWCITCKVNERVAFSSDRFFERANQLGVVLMLGDWTNPNEEIAQFLKQHNRNGIPLYLIYPAGNQTSPTVLPQILTASTLIKALENAAGQP